MQLVTVCSGGAGLTSHSKKNRKNPDETCAPVEGSVQGIGSVGSAKQFVRSSRPLVAGQLTIIGWLIPLISDSLENEFAMGLNEPQTHPLLCPNTFN